MGADAAAVGVAVVAGGVRITRKGMAHVDRIAFVGVQGSVRLVRNLHRADRGARLQHQRVVLRKQNDPLGLGQAKALRGCAGRQVVTSIRRLPSTAPGRDP